VALAQEVEAFERRCRDRMDEDEFDTIDGCLDELATDVWKLAIDLHRWFTHGRVKTRRPGVVDGRPHAVPPKRGPVDEADAPGSPMRAATDLAERLAALRAEVEAAAGTSSGRDAKDLRQATGQLEKTLGHLWAVAERQSKAVGPKTSALADALQAA
jgi:hypothetical protein